MIEKVNEAYRFKTRIGDYVYIGDPKEPEFHPKITLNRWDGECFLRLAFDDSKITEKTCKLEENKVKWETPDFDFHFYPVESRKIVIKHPQTGEDITFLQNELGGLEFEIILKRKPASNQITLAIETKGLKFHYQPPLHPEHPTWADEDEDGIADNFRPENVVGSYAVYHATHSNMHRSKEDAEKYRVGKAFHIYRPLAKDSAGNEAWCDLHVDEAKGVLTVTIPQEFLDKAVYPVSVDPTFGYDVVGGSKVGSGQDVVQGSWFTCPESGTADSITVYVDYYGDTYPGKCALYYKSDNSYIAETEEKTGMSSPAWYTFIFPSPPSLQNIDYWLVHFWDGTGEIFNVHFIHYDDYTGKGGRSSETYPTFPDPWEPTLVDRIYSIYCTYTAGGQEILVSDSGQAVETVGLNVQLAISESGLGTEKPLIGLKVSDQGSGAEQLSVQSLIKAEELSSGAELVSLKAEAKAYESVFAVEDVALKAEAKTIDSGQATEKPLIGLKIFEESSAVERAGLEAVVKAFDSGQCVEKPLIGLKISDQALGMEQLSVKGLVKAEEWMFGTEIVGLKAETKILEQSSTIEKASLKADVKASDLASGTEKPSLMIEVNVSDFGQTFEKPSLKAELKISDFGLGSDEASVFKPSWVKGIKGELSLQTQKLSLASLSQDLSLAFQNMHLELEVVS